MRLTPASIPNFEKGDRRTVWPIRWISVPSPASKSYLIAYRLVFSLDEPARLRVHVSADQRYRLFLDGERLGEGPERGDFFNWYYQSYDLELAAGEHTFVALVWTLEMISGIVPGAQISFDHGLVLAADTPFTELVSTGSARWEFKEVEGVAFRPSGLTGAGELSGATVRIDGERYPWGVELGRGDDWCPALVKNAARGRLGNDNWGLLDSPLLKRGGLPTEENSRHLMSSIRFVGELPVDGGGLQVTSAARLQEVEKSLKKAWSKRSSFTVPPRSQWWILVDLEDYFCGYPELHLSEGRGAEIEVLWAEALLVDPHDGRTKGHRDEIDGKYFSGRGDAFQPKGDGEVTFYTSFWWSCGRYVAVLVRTAEEPLTIDPPAFRESRYPLEATASIRFFDDAFDPSQKLMWRAVQMCAHETYMDCPYYEQMNYAADTRIQILVTYAISGDARLARRCIELFASSMLPSGMTSARYPAELPQVIPQFSLFWVAMLHDFARWQDDLKFVRSLLPHARFLLDAFCENIEPNGLLQCPDGWNWVDWAWRRDSSRTEFSAVNQLQLVYVLRLAAELERRIGREDIAHHYEGLTQKLWNCAVERYWVPSRGLFAASSKHEIFGEHEQCFAILSGMMDPEQTAQVRTALARDPDLHRATFYFRHYLFEAYAALGLQEKIYESMHLWRKLVDLGLHTTVERDEQDRSDCHAWSAHPLYHAVVSIAGIKPEGFGSRRFSISPAIAVVPRASVSVVRPEGRISVEWETLGERVNLSVSVPLGLEATLGIGGRTIGLRPGSPLNFRLDEGRLDETVPDLEH
jgi:hypothetical protein